MLNTYHAFLFHIIKNKVKIGCVNYILFLYTFFTHFHMSNIFCFFFHFFGIGIVPDQKNPEEILRWACHVMRVPWGHEVLTACDLRGGAKLLTACGFSVYLCILCICNMGLALKYMEAFTSHSFPTGQIIGMLKSFLWHPIWHSNSFAAITQNGNKSNHKPRTAKVHILMNMLLRRMATVWAALREIQNETTFKVNSHMCLLHSFVKLQIKWSFRFFFVTTLFVHFTFIIYCIETQNTKCHVFLNKIGLIQFVLRVCNFFSHLYKVKFISFNVINVLMAKDL